MPARDDQHSSHGPYISVLMPVYNAERYVAEAVESILTQTFTDFEFLIVDDGSIDDTPELLRRYEKSDSRVRLTVRTNLGLVPTLNEMLRAARGEFIARMDADDIALPSRLLSQVAFMRGHPENRLCGYFLHYDRRHGATANDGPS